VGINTDMDFRTCVELNFLPLIALDFFVADIL